MNMNSPGLGFNPIILTAYKKDKGNPAILWLNHKEVLDLLNKALEYYNKYPTPFNKLNLENFQKASKIKGMVPFGQGCIATATNLWGTKPYISNQIFAKDSDNGFHKVVVINPVNRFLSNTFEKLGDELTKITDNNNDTRYYGKPIGFTPVISNVSGPDSTHPLGVQQLKIVPKLKTKDMGLLDNYYSNMYKQIEQLYNKSNDFRKNEDEQYINDLNSKALVGDILQMVNNFAPHHSMIYSGKDTDFKNSPRFNAIQNHGDVGKDLHNKFYNFGFNEPIIIWRRN